MGTWWYRRHPFDNDFPLQPQLGVIELPQTQRGRKKTRKGRHLHTSQPAAQLLGEEDNGQLALAVGCLGVILSRLPVQVVEVYVPSNVSQRREIDDAGRGRGLQFVQQQIRQ